MGARNGHPYKVPHNNTFNVILMFIFKGLVRP